MKNCLKGYLTDKCENCSFWADGNDGSRVGCAIHAPIMECPDFAEMYKKNEAERIREGWKVLIDNGVEQADAPEIFSLLQYALFNDRTSDAKKILMDRGIENDKVGVILQGVEDFV